MIISSFNSLQTGKHIQRQQTEISKTETGKFVSIPFKRESIYKVKREASARITSQVFQFPSNGKAYTKSLVNVNKSRTFIVSIPFKRESIYKESIDELVLCLREQFQFPSNGKAYTKEIHRKTIH